jgi:two-component system, response regulator RegA
MQHHFLIVDAADAGRARLARQLEAKGFVVQVADTAGAAISLAGAHAPTLVLLEPAAVGLAVVPALKLAAPACAVIVLTACGSIAMAVRAVRAGAIGFLLKPAAVSQILDAAGTGSPETEPAYPSLDRHIWEYISCCVESAGSIGEAARRLRIHRRSLSRMLRKVPPVL